MSDYYEGPGNTIVSGTRARAASVVANLVAIAASFAKLPPPDQIGGGTGATGPASAFQPDLAALRAWPVTNRIAFFKGGQYNWTLQDYSDVLAVDTVGAFCVKADAFAASSGAWVRQDANKIDVEWCGAVGDGANGASATDNAVAFEIAAAVGDVLNRPLTGPNKMYCTSKTFWARSGIDAEGKFTIAALPGTQDYWAQTVEGDPQVNRPIVRFGWHLADRSEFCTVPSKGFRTRGLSLRTSARSSDPASSGFLGTGIMFDESCKDMMLDRVDTGFCYKGWLFNQRNGHTGALNSKSHDCWFNRFFERQTGDNRFFNIDLTGALFAGTGGHDTLKEGGISTGGFIGVDDLFVHSGFAPLVWFMPTGGTGTVGRTNCSSKGSSAEQVGCSFFKGGTGPGRNSSGNHDEDLRMNFTTESDTANYNAYTILNDNNYPPKEPMRLSLVQGARNQISGFGLARGAYNGIVAHTIIDNLLAPFVDQFDPSGITVINNSKDLVIGIRPVWENILPTSGATLNTGGEPTLVAFALPQDMNNTVNFVVSISATSTNPGSTPVKITLKQRLNAGGSADIATVTIPPGEFPFYFSRNLTIGQNLAGRTVTITATAPTSGIVLTAGQATVRSVNPGTFQ